MLPFNNLGSVRSLKKSLILTKAAFIWSKNTVKTVILWNIITIKNKKIIFEYVLKCKLFLWCKAEFSASLLHSSMSHDPHPKSFNMHGFFRILWWIESSKEQLLFEIEIFYNIINAFTSLLINLKCPCWIKVLKKCFDPKLLNGRSKNEKKSIGFFSLC